MGDLNRKEQHPFNHNKQMNSLHDPIENQILPFYLIKEEKENGTLLLSQKAKR